jgi:predicted CXXCH cytochrome family protein
MSKNKRKNPQSTVSPSVSSGTPVKPAWRGWLLPTGLLLLLLVSLAWWAQPGWFMPVSSPQTPVHVAPISPQPLEMVDEQACQGCHAEPVKQWQGSHHHLAMQEPNAQTVLGDFNDVTFSSDKETTRFFRKDDAFWVNTPGPDGQPADFKVAYTFGLEPLQQYLLELPGGHLQPLGVAWDTQKQAWFHLYPGQGIDASDPLHWTKTAQNANYMCIECHTTGFKRNFDAKNNSFASHWQALGVGCQSCHGPASGHLAWAEKGEQNASAKGFEQPLLSKTDNRGQVQVCARCHALRSPLGDGFQHSAALLDDYLPSDLTSTQYEVDGRIKGEVFEYGSFTQSKMFAKGVACTNCHNPHSTKLKLEGNAVCTQCHNPAGKTAVPGVDGAGLQARDYDSPAHTHHPAGSAAAQCTACHMPGKFYMGNDFRHDHSFSVPNPAQSAALGTPDACQGCHRETKSARLIEQFNTWYPDAKPHDGGYAVALDAARRGSSGAARGLLTQLQRTDLPALRRAALLTELASYPSAPALNQISSALKDPDPQVREAAVRALPGMAAPQQIGQLLPALLRDPVLAVRLAATWELAQQPPEARQNLTPAFWQQVLDEYEQVQLQLLERGEANMNLASLYQISGRNAQIEASLRAALQRDPDFLPALVSLSQLLEQNNPQEARQLLADALQRNPDEALLYHAEGLALVRSGDYPAAIKAFAKAAELAPENPQYGYVLAIALHDSGQREEAIAQLQAMLKRQPQNRNASMALLNYAQETRDAALIQQVVGDIWEINPDDPMLQSRLPKR